MKKMKLILCLLTLGLFFWSCPASASFVWYYGTDPNIDYMANYNVGEWSIPLPFTLEASGEEMAGAGGPILYYTGSGSGGYRFDFNMGWYWGVYNGTFLIPNGFALAVDWPSVILPEGSYTSDPTTGGIYYWGASDPNHTGSLFQAQPLNNFVIQVGQMTPTPTPEPTTMLLLGLGLMGLAGVKRKFLV